jgi:hypothetical protein
MGLPQGENERLRIEMQSANESKRFEDTEGSLGGSNRHLSSGSLVQLNDATDEFFDIPDESEYDQREAMWSSDESTHAAVSYLHLKPCICVCMIEGSYVINLLFLLINDGTTYVPKYKTF